MKNFLSKAFGAGEGAQREETDVRVAACALFLEMANIDNEFSEEERQSILEIVRTEFGLSRDDALELAREAAAQLHGSIDLWHFTNRVNENYSEAEKARVVELLWRIVYADGKLDAHEDYLIHKMAKLLNLPHKVMIAAKLRVLNEEKGD